MERSIISFSQLLLSSRFFRMVSLPCACQRKVSFLWGDAEWRDLGTPDQTFIRCVQSGASHSFFFFFAFAVVLHLDMAMDLNKEPSQRWLDMNPCQINMSTIGFPVKNAQLH